MTRHQRTTIRDALTKALIFADDEAERRGSEDARYPIKASRTADQLRRAINLLDAIT